MNKILLKATALLTAAVITFTSPITTMASKRSDSQGTDNERYLAFCSDLHGHKTALETAMEGFPENTEYVSIIGDLVGDGGGDAPAYNALDIYDRTHKIIPQLKTSQFSILWADHDSGAVNEENIVKCEGGNTSDQIYECLNDDGSAAYFIYGIGYYHMIDGGSVSKAAAQDFKNWVSGIDKTIPIIVLCHVPIQAKRGDNLGASYWNEALNYAATGVEGITDEKIEAEVTRNIIYLYGHNHTVDKTEYVFRAGTTMTVQIDTTKESGLFSESYYEENGDNIITTESEDEEYTAQLGAGAMAKAEGVVSNIYYTAMIPGYLKTSQNASLMKITDDEIRITKYNSGEEVSLGTDGATGEIMDSTLVIDQIK